MKKLVIYFTAIIVLFGGLYALNVAANGSTDNPYGVREGKLKPDTRKLLDDPNYQNIIKPDELETSLKNGYTGFVFFFSSSCPHCKVTVPEVVPMANDLGIDMPMYNLLEYPEGWNQYGLQWTPTLVYYKDGRKADELVGGIEVSPGDGGWTKEQYREFFEKYKQQ